MRPLRLGLMAALAAWLAASLAACLPESEHPVGGARQDPRLWGAWLHVAEDGFSIVHVLAEEADRLRIITIDHDVEGVGSDPDSYTAFATKLPGGEYLNVLVSGSETGYLVGKYVFQGTDRVSFAFPSDEALKKAVKSGALPGTITDEAGGRQDLRITASPQQWQVFLAKAPPELFADQLEFERVGPAYVSE